MIPTNRIKSLQGFSKGELVGYSNFEYPFRIMTLERGDTPTNDVVWIGETYGTKYIMGGRVAHVWRVPISHIFKIEQSLGKIKL